MTRADDLRADLVQRVNAYILDNLDPALAEEEDEALHEAGDIVDLVLQAACVQTMQDLAEIGEAMHQAQFAARRADGRLAYESEPTEQTWWETWPATALVHAQERYAGTATGADLAYEASDPLRDEYETRQPICVCSSDDLYCQVHDA